MPVAGFPFADLHPLGRVNSTPNNPNQANDHNLFAQLLQLLRDEIEDFESNALVEAGQPGGMTITGSSTGNVGLTLRGGGAFLNSAPVKMVAGGFEGLRMRSDGHVILSQNPAEYTAGLGFHAQFTVARGDRSIRADNVDKGSGVVISPINAGAILQLFGSDDQTGVAQNATGNLSTYVLKNTHGVEASNFGLMTWSTDPLAGGYSVNPNAAGALCPNGFFARLWHTTDVTGGLPLVFGSNITCNIGSSPDGGNTVDRNITQHPGLVALELDPNDHSSNVGINPGHGLRLTTNGLNPIENAILATPGELCNGKWRTILCVGIGTKAFNPTPKVWNNNSFNITNITSVAQGDGTYIATITTAAPHGWSSRSSVGAYGEWIVISGVVGGLFNNPNGKEILTVPSATTLTVRYGSNPGTYTSGGLTQVVWMSGTIVDFGGVKWVVVNNTLLDPFSAGGNFTLAQTDQKPLANLIWYGPTNATGAALNGSQQPLYQVDKDGNQTMTGYIDFKAIPAPTVAPSNANRLFVRNNAGTYQLCMQVAGSTTVRFIDFT